MSLEAIFAEGGHVVSINTGCLQMVWPLKNYR